MPEAFNIQVKDTTIPCRLARASNGNWVAACRIPTKSGPIRIRVAASEKLIKQTIMPMIVRMFKAWKDATGQAYVGLFGFIKKAFRKIKRVVRKVAKAKLIRRLGRTIKKVVNNPVVAKLAGFAKYVPVYGTAIHAGYKAVRKAVNVADGIAKRSRRALRTVSKLKRMMRHPRANARQRHKAMRALRLVRMAYAKRYGYGRRRSTRRVGYVCSPGRRCRGYMAGNVTHTGAMEGAKWLWDELKLHRGVQEGTFTRTSYVDGLKALTA